MVDTFNPSKGRGICEFRTTGVTQRSPASQTSNDAISLVLVFPPEIMYPGPASRVQYSVLRSLALLTILGF